MRRVGVLALQGDVGEHVAIWSPWVPRSSKFARSNSWTVSKRWCCPAGSPPPSPILLATSGLKDELVARLKDEMPVFGTCAGLILLSDEMLDGRGDQWSYGALAVAVRRNGYGRQIASFETTLDVKGLGDVPGVFIRAPKIERWTDEVEVLASLDHGDGEHPVLVRHGHVWGASFHPELTGDSRLHGLFLDSI